jgi:hypothetical protein
MVDELKHCCIYMDYALSGRNGYLVEYMPETRSYSLRFYRGDEFTGLEKELWYCPWCGKKFPKTLGDKWEELLKKEYNLTINNFFNKNGKWDESRIPEEFRSDEWWKKRGL